MTAFVTFFCVMSMLSLVLHLCDMARGQLPKQITRGQQAFIVFVRCAYVGWALWLLAVAQGGLNA